VSNIADFCDTRLPKIKQTGIEVLGVIPHCRELPSFSVGYLADRLFAKIIAGEKNLNRTARNIFIGSMSVNAATQNPTFAEQNKLLITGGDRSDMILAALQSSTAAILLTNNISPAPNLIAQAERLRIPILLLPADIHDVARQIDSMEALPTRNDHEKISLVTELIREHIDMKGLFPA
jgi:BioD-like phosphotransacetylase family protein